jgi:hypothetical protein
VRPPQAGAIHPVQVRPKLKGSVLRGSECCVATGDSGCEAYTAIARGVGLSHERLDIAGAKSFYSSKATCAAPLCEGADALPGSKATSRAKGSHRKLGGLVTDRQRRVRGTVRIGKVRSRRVSHQGLAASALLRGGGLWDGAAGASGKSPPL